MMSLIPQNIKDKAGKSAFIKAKDFEAGLDLIVQGFEIVKAKDPKYGADDKNYLVSQGILQIGETCRYSFKTIEDKSKMDSFSEDKTFETASTVFFISFKNLDPESGEKVRIKREGQGRNTKYDITRIQNE